MVTQVLFVLKGNYKIVVDLHNSGYYSMTITKL
jgi:hypothetical protein